MNQRLVGRVIFPLHERLKRKPTFERLRELERTQWLVPERLAEYRLDRLRQLLTFADHHVPYYHALFAGYSRWTTSAGCHSSGGTSCRAARPTSARAPPCPGCTRAPPAAPPAPRSR